MIFLASYYMYSFHCQYLSKEKGRGLTFCLIQSFNMFILHNRIYWLNWNSKKKIQFLPLKFNSIGYEYFCIVFTEDFFQKVFDSQETFSLLAFFIHFFSQWRGWGIRCIVVFQEIRPIGICPSEGIRPRRMTTSKSFYLH